MKLFLSCLFLFISYLCQSQDIKPFIPEGDAKYFDFWEGTWFEIKADNSLDSNSYFKIKRGVNPSCFIEEWHFTNGMNSIAIRAWDKTNNKWGFVWTSDNGLYQVWDTKKVDGNWYIYKQFTINNDTYLSRQGFISQVDGTVLRISEKTYDEKNWELRFKQRLKKVSK
ncbi:MAG TPA: hypothetical protein VGQ09_19375 [Chitinophagaceae bacterium]|jgi:hypothetical protein|nr:hypothetical protein [Chitinophagaceae bacterium]